MAAAIAQIGHNVLIIDADMRCPSQHQFWEISNSIGLSNFLSEQTNFSKTIIQTVMENLDVLPLGALPPNPSVLIDSRRMATLLKECSNHYSYVLVDTPPLAVAADASILGKMADGVVLVTRPGLADPINSRFTKEYLDQSGQNVLGIVVNGVLPENEPDSYYPHKRDDYEELSSRETVSSRKKNWREYLRLFKRP